MYNKSKSLFVLSLFVIIAGCSKNNDKKELLKNYKKFSVENIKIDTLSEKKIDYDDVKILDIHNEDLAVLKGTSIIDSCWYIPLETKDESVFGHIDKIIIEDEYIFILDSRNTGNLFVFSMDGDFVFKINKKGKGPQEYTRINDFTIDSDNKNIIIHDDRLAKLFYFNFEGSFVKTVKTSFRFANLCKQNNIMYYLLGNRSNLHLPILNNKSLIKSNEGLINTYNTYDIKNEVNLKLSKFDQFYYSGNHLSFTIPVTKNFIYNIEKGEVKPTYQLNFGKKNITKLISQKLKDYKSYYKATKDLDFNMFIGTHFETKSKLFIQYVENSKYRNLFFDKVTGNTILWERFVSDDIHTAGDIVSHYAIYEEDIFVNFKEPSVFVNTLKNINKIDFKSARVKELCKTLNKTDNPVLCFYKLKSF
ncbi:6-bladed beta-propeller [Flavisericum labens]|uniref:6-bladed beta-propeller n=1 Tax=Flavisericum labens TaxID=3377112 RepID=UPI00387B8F8D